jgi:hypothetical protein
MSTETGEELLLAAAEAWHRGDGMPGMHHIYLRWTVPGGYDTRGKTMGGLPAEFAVWVAAAAGSGVLGGAAYDAFKSLIMEVRQRIADRRHHGDQRALNVEDASFLTILAVRAVFVHEGLDASTPIGVLDVNEDSGTWRIEVSAGGRRFLLEISDRSPEDVVVFGRQAENTR